MDGNLTLTLKTKTTTQNEYGEDNIEWTDMCSTTGFLDMLTYDKNSKMSAMIQNANYVFITDGYTVLSETDANMLMAYINSIAYNVIYIDDPMNLHEFYEIYLKKVGA